MFSRYRNAPATAATLVCLLVLICSAVSVSEPSHAKTRVTPNVQPGDPDEFEASVPQPGMGRRTPLSADSSEGEAGQVQRGIRQEEVTPDRKGPPFWYGARLGALRRFIAFVALELDVR